MLCNKDQMPLADQGESMKVTDYMWGSEAGIVHPGGRIHLWVF